MQQSMTVSPLWFFRSDSNITKNPEAQSMRELFSYLQTWKEDVDATKLAKRRCFEPNCYICGEQIATIYTLQSTSASYPICNICKLNM